MEKRAKGEADVIVYCHEGSNSLNELHQPRLEGTFNFNDCRCSFEQDKFKIALLM